MKIGFQVVLYILILNMICSLMYQQSVAGTVFSKHLAGTTNASVIAEEFEPQRFMNESSTILSEFLTFTGHIWGALNTFWNTVDLVVFGFPRMMRQIGYQIDDLTARQAFTNFSYVLYAVMSIIMFTWLFQILTGREVEE